MKKLLIAAIVACTAIIGLFDYSYGQTACINVKNPPYNATGDGVTNDYTAIQNAINAGSCVFFPGVLFSGAVTSSNVVTITVFNANTSSIDLPSGTLRADVWKH